MSAAVLLHPDHGDHELRCVTFGCYHYGHALAEANASQRLACLTHHAVRCITCHCWADDPARKPAPRPAPETPPADDQLSLFEGQS